MQFNKHEPENKVFKWMQTREPRRILYNGLVPFAVSIFEFFFSQSFQILIKYDEFAINKLQKHSMKVEFADILNISEGHLSIEQLISSKYSFQNITQVNKAFNEWLNIDFLKIISKKRKIGNKVVRLNDIINDIIKYRHGVIHHLLIDTSMTKEEYINILTAVRKTIEEFTLFLENKYSIEIEKL